MPTHYSEQHDPVSTGIIQEYGTGGGYIYDQIAPTIRVNSQSFQYGTRDFGPEMSQYVDTKMAPSGPANVYNASGYTLTDAVTERHGLKGKIEDNEAFESPNPAADLNALLKELMQNLRIGLETELKTDLDAASNATTLTGTSQWNNASAVIEKSIDTAKESFVAQCGFEANTLVVPPACWQVFKRDSTLRGDTKYTHGDILDGNGGYSDNIFNLDFVIPGALLNSANQGATASIARLWATDKVYLMYIDKGVTSTKTAVTAAYFASQFNTVDQMFLSRNWRPGDADMEWTWHEIWEWHKLIVDSRLVHRLDDVLA